MPPLRSGRDDNLPLIKSQPHRLTLGGREGLVGSARMTILWEFDETHYGEMPPKPAFRTSEGRQMVYYERYVETWLSPPFATGIPDHCCGRRRRDAAPAGMAARGGRRG